MLAGKTYCPVLHTRVAEMKGLEKLPEASKNLMFPLIAARPWPNANLLSKTWEKIEASFGKRRYALDLDRFKYGASSDRLAAKQFDALFDPANGHAAYYEALAEIDGAIPVLRLTKGLIPDLEQQLAWINWLDRGAVLRVEHEYCQQPTLLVRQVRALIPDVVLFLDLGWKTPDLISREMWASQILSDISEEVDLETEIVVVGSSFPGQFRPLVRDEVLVEERFVYDALVRRHNSISITYGDWGSTRAPRDPTPMRTVKRIDLPLSREWVCFRDAGSEDYAEIATRAVRDASWPLDLNIWGTYLISGTAQNVPGSIRGQAAAAAARINIHMFRQTHFDEMGLTGDGDEPFVD
jgi:hypothetical protein